MFKIYSSFFSLLLLDYSIKVHYILFSFVFFFISRKQLQLQHTLSFSAHAHSKVLPRIYQLIIAEISIASKKMTHKTTQSRIFTHRSKLSISTEQYLFTLHAYISQLQPEVTLEIQENLHSNCHKVCGESSTGSDGPKQAIGHKIYQPLSFIGSGTKEVKKFLKRFQKLDHHLLFIEIYK